LPEPEIELHLNAEEAEALHSTLEELIESGRNSPSLDRAYRMLGWRLLAAKGGSGLTARMAEIAREASTLEEFEEKRDEGLGPVVKGLERGENRDP
jgi:hypothetical protein